MENPGPAFFFPVGGEVLRPLVVQPQDFRPGPEVGHLVSQDGRAGGMGGSWSRRLSPHGAMRVRIGAAALARRCRRRARHARSSAWRVVYLPAVTGAAEHVRVRHANVAEKDVV